MARPARALVYPNHLRHNARRVRALAPDSRIMACVKADAYGHGIISAAQAIDELVDGFAVACIEEALVLRQAGIDRPILLLEGPLEEAEIAEAAARDLMLCITEERQLAWLEQNSSSGSVRCWLKLDTGMHRLGIDAGGAAHAYQRLADCPSVRGDITVCTHFARADEPENPATHQQLERFDEAVKALRAPQSCANSAGIMLHPASHRDWVRPGYMLYGGCPAAGRSAAEWGLLPGMALRSEVISVRGVPRGHSVGYGGRWIAGRDSRIATIAIGYGDGYPRHAPDGTPVLLAGRRLPLAGRVSMDMITVDITDAPEVTPGTPACLWGQELPVDEIAAAADTIGYELLAGMPPRVVREQVL